MEQSAMLSSILLISLAGLAFGVIHTILAANRVKNWARRRWGTQLVDRWYRLFFSLAGAVTFAPLLLLTQFLPDRALYRIPAPWVWLTSGLQLAALIVFIVALLQTDVWRFIGLRQLLRGGKPIPVDQHERLVTSGPYSRVRHPLYSTVIVAMWLWPDMTVNRATFFAVSMAYFFLGSIPEEEKLLQEFGDAYRRYRQVVPRLIPLPGRVYRRKA
jgi:protein-S-isoprenylcysteine O-methyltransferase Ste14